MTFDKLTPFLSLYRFDPGGVVGVSLNLEIGNPVL